ncbi:radical SAM protein [Candidatus Woesearchaeota archaeon]|nr:radical SAM protein [Candidatus Woesearchaeota archaeon]
MEHNLSVKTDYISAFGNQHDGVIEIVGIVPGGVIEVGYFYGDAKPKNIVDISTQVGCPMSCSFCELGSERFVRNLTAQEIADQVTLMLDIAQKHGIDTARVPHKVTIAKTGEPLLNPHVREGLERIATLSQSFKISTVYPHNCHERLKEIADFASHYQRTVQLQISLISTSEEYRRKTAGKGVAGFEEIRAGAHYWREKNPTGRKINLSLILTEDVPCDVRSVRHIFPPELFRFRFRNYVPTTNGTSAGLHTLPQQKFEQILEEFRTVGYDVNEAATPTPTELKFGLAANVTRRRYLEMTGQTVRDV